MNRIELLDNAPEIGKIDKSGMLVVVEKTPQLLLEALELSKKTSIPKLKNIEHVVISGMGGSAISGDIVRNLLLWTGELPVFVLRGYRVPAFVSKNTLFISLSYSGNTEETLSALKEAQKREAGIVCVTSGGRLKEIAESNGYPLYLIPEGYQPRAALPFLLVLTLKCLEGLGLLAEAGKEIKKAIELLSRLKEEYGINRPQRLNPVKQLAKRLQNKVPVIFGSFGRTDAAALRLKTQLNENSKMTAFYNAFPELDHNEIVSLSNLRREEHKFSLIFLRDEGDLERVQKRMVVTKSLVGRQLGGVNEIFAQGKALLPKLLSLIYYGDFLSVYLAILQGIDPTPVDVISKLKKELNR